MNVEVSSNDILEQYRVISSKLRKRYFRKTNESEASKAFISLATQCENNELLPHSGMCWIAAARCEGSLGNSTGETNCLLKAARQFVKTEIKDDSLGCSNIGNENIQAALSCYSYATSKCTENNFLSIAYNLEIADIFKKFGTPENAEQYLKLCLVQSSNVLSIRLHCLDLLSSCYVKSGDYTSALAVFTEIYTLLDGKMLTAAENDLMLRCELSRVFLLLILRPSPQRLAPSLAKLLEKYMWGNMNDPTIRIAGMSEHLFILMQSLVMACQSLDTTAIPEVEADLWPHLSTDLRSLLRCLIRQYNI